MADAFEIDFRAAIPRDVRRIDERLRAAKRRSWVVGGSVRDLLLRRAVSDWDLATDARPEEVMGLFPKAIPTGIAHGTVTVVMSGAHYEVTTLRGEGAYTDGRRPDAVHFVDDIVADLARRDFTVNAIALEPEHGTVVDPFGGLGDLEARVLRAVGDANERFAEDGLRVLRAARFVATLELSLDAGTEAAIEPNLPTFRKVSPERVRDEWLKAMKAVRPSRAFEVMRRTGILGVTCPELLEGVALPQNRYHAFDVWEHTMQCLDACAGDPILRLAALLHDVGKPRTRAFSDKTDDYTFYQHELVGADLANAIALRLRLSNDERARVVHLVRQHIFFHTDEWSDATVRRWLRRVGPDHVSSLFALNEADIRAKGRDIDGDLASLARLKEHVAKVLADGAALSVRDLAIDGRILMAELGLSPGRRVGELLAALLEEVTANPELNEAGVLLERARALHAQS